MWFSILIFLLLGVVFLIDAVPQLDIWQSRIKIGRYKDSEVWESKVVTLSRKWLGKLPTIKLTDNDRLIIIDILKGNYKRTAIQSWQEAALILGLSQYAKKTNCEEVQQEVRNFLRTKTTQVGKWKIKPTESDFAILAYSFLQTDFIDHQKYKPAFDETYEMIVSLVGEDGTAAYKKYNNTFRFVDTIGFICPFLVHYGRMFNVPEAVDLAVTQIFTYQTYGMMETENIPCHSYLVESKIPVGLFGWGRGLGWWVIGLIDTWNALPPDHYAKSELEHLILKTVKSALKFQKQDGSYTWLIFNENTRADSSATATMAWFYTIATKIPQVEVECDNARLKCLQYLQSVTRRDGTIDFSQGDTKDIGVYSMNFDKLPFTQGFTLRSLYL